MLFPIYVSLVHLFVSAVYADYSPEEFIRLTQGVCKASYFLLESGEYLKDGFIMEKSGSSSVKSCEIGGWKAKVYEENESEVLMFENVEQKLVVFGFRGTELNNIQDWEANLDVILVKETIDNNSFKIHRGFLERYGWIASWFEDEYSRIPDDYTLLLTGHSLGGAEATIAAVYAAGKLNRKPDAVITYGSPKVGNYEFEGYYEQVVGCKNTVRMASPYDLVSHVPSKPYFHVCDPLKVVGSHWKFLNFAYQHSLYEGYEDGIRKKYKDKEEDINTACAKTLV